MNEANEADDVAAGLPPEVLARFRRPVTSAPCDRPCCQPRQWSPVDRMAGPFARLDRWYRWAKHEERRTAAWLLEHGEPPKGRAAEAAYFNEYEAWCEAYDAEHLEELTGCQ